MGIFTDNPVLLREVRGRLRGRRKGGGRANRWVAWLLGIVIAYYYLRGLAGVWHGTGQDARDLWPLLVYGALTLIVLLAPALAATAITQEREQQTWETLVITRLPAAEVLLGKWLGRQLVPGLLLLILLPYLAVCVLRGAIGWLVLPTVLGFLLVTNGCYSALGLLCSFQARRTATATAAALFIMALICVGTIIVNEVINLLSLHGFNNAQTPVLWANPFVVLGNMSELLLPPSSGSQGGSLGQADDLSATAWYILLSAAATAAALVSMIRRYDRSVERKP